jgi:hypothetical protein
MQAIVPKEEEEETMVETMPSTRTESLKANKNRYILAMMNPAQKLQDDENQGSNETVAADEENQNDTAGKAEETSRDQVRDNIIDALIIQPESGDAAKEEHADDPLPRAFHDPITYKVMVDPVVLEDGMSYEKKDAMERGENAYLMYPNRALKAFIQSELDRLQVRPQGCQRRSDQSASPAGPEYPPLPGESSVQRNRST